MTGVREASLPPSSMASTHADRMVNLYDIHSSGASTCIRPQTLPCAVARPALRSCVAPTVECAEIICREPVNDHGMKYHVVCWTLREALLEGFARPDGKPE